MVGDIIATALSLWLVREARALGAPWHVTARMLGNVAIQGVVGTVPVAGDAFDVLFRANMRNARLLRRWMEQAAALALTPLSEKANAPGMVRGRFRRAMANGNLCRFGVGLSPAGAASGLRGRRGSGKSWLS